MPQNKMGQDLKSLQPGPLQQWPDSVCTVSFTAESYRAPTGHLQEAWCLLVSARRVVAVALLQIGPGLRVQWALTAAQQHWPQWFASFQGREFRLLSSPSFCTAFTCGNALVWYLSWGSLPASCGTRAVGWGCVWTSSLHSEIYKNITHCF